MLTTDNLPDYLMFSYGVLSGSARPPVGTLIAASSHSFTRSDIPRQLTTLWCVPIPVWGLASPVLLGIFRVVADAQHLRSK